VTRTSPATDHWSVTTRTQGGVQSAVASLPSIEMALLGIPEGFTAAEIQSWLRDLAGVAVETSRTDERSRPIPQLLHHVLTGLLFSQTELWSHTGQALPCAAVFVETPQGTAFGWVGRARVVLLVNGEPFEPQWVIVRDESGQEAMSAMLPPRSHVLLTLEYWPHGESGQHAPASADAEWGQSFANQPAPSGDTARASASSAGLPRPVASPMPVTPGASGSATPAPVTPVAPSVSASAPLGSSPALPIQQPGLAPDPTRQLSLDERDATQSVPSTFHASSSTFSMPSLPGSTPGEPSSELSRGVPRPETDLTRGRASLESAGEQEPGHPVGRWLTRLMGFGKKPRTEQEPESFASAPSPRPSGATFPTIPATLPAAAPPVLPVSLAATSSATPPTLEPSLAATSKPPTLTPPTLTPSIPPPASPTPPPVTASAPVTPPPALFVPGATPAEPKSAPAVPVLTAPGTNVAPVVPTPPAPPLAGPVAQPTPVVPPVSPPVTPPAIAPPLNAPVSPTPTAATNPAPIPPSVTPAVPVPVARSVTPPVAPTVPPSASQSAPPSSRPPATPPAKSGLLAVGLNDILGGLASVAPRKPVAPAAEPPATRSAPPPTPREAAAPATPSAPPAPSPHPVLQVSPPKPAAGPRGPIQIEREPVGAAAEFAIPKLPPRDAPKPFRVPVPTAADSVKPATPSSPGVDPARPSPGVPAAPAASPPSPAAPASTAAPPASAPPAPARSAAVPVVPEPPADFLAEFAASLGADIKDMPPASPSAEVRRPVPPLPSVMRAVANVTPPVPPAPSAPAPTASHASSSIPPLPPLELPPSSVLPPLLITPSEDAPISVSQSELPVILRELPLPGGAHVEGDVPEGMLVATPISSVRSRRSQWPAAEDFEPASRPAWRNPWIIGAFVAVLFGVGWVVGHSQTADNDIHATPVSRMLKAVGLAGARFTATVDSDPPGAIISVDGKEVGRRTPATIELPPGEHKITLAMPELGQVDVDVKGSRGQAIKVNEALHGSLEVTALDKSLPVKVSLDGQLLGFLPQTVEKLPPGLHEVQFSGPNMQPWAQNVSVPIRGTATVKARPMMSPATGVLQVQAILNDEGGSAPLSGASLFVDGELKGSTPETLELPRGPHSIKVVYRGVAAPVQVIDLPGGNKRFAQFQFGLDTDLPPLKLKNDYGTLPARKTIVIEASLDGLDWKDVREAWLHVRTGEGLWRRYQVTVEEGPRGALLTAYFPTAVGDAGSRVNWYMSAATNQGDDFYTEMQRSMR